jgi:hypothetical protein
LGTKSFKMASNLPLNFLRIVVTFLFILLLAFILFFIVKSISQFVDNDGFEKRFGTTFIYNAKGRPASIADATYAFDSVARFEVVTDSYNVYITPRSSQGIYAFVSKLIFLLLAATILWQMVNLFRKRTLSDPFNIDVIRRLKLLAWLFIIGDGLKLVDYFIFNGLARRLFPSQNFQQIMEFGNGIVTGCIIWIVMAVLNRGQQLKEENALTV